MSTRTETRDNGRENSNHHRAYRRHNSEFVTNGRDEHRSLGTLMRELASQTQSLVHLEVQLAKTEITEKAAVLGKNAGLVAGGGLVAYAGLIVLIMALGFLLGSFMPDWLGFFIAGLVVAMIGAGVLMSGVKRLKEVNLGLEKTAETIQEDKEWIREEAADVKKDPAHLGSHQ